MQIQHFFDQETATFTYIVSDPDTQKCAIIDPVLNYNIHTGRIKTHSADQLIEHIQNHQLTVEWILETHAHADHLTAAYYLKEKLGGKIAIGEHIKSVLKFWVPVFNIIQDTPLDGSQFDHLFKDAEVFSIGNLNVKVMHTPGHTPACVSYLINDVIFVGDTIFMPYIGTARTDFPGGSAKDLYHSIQKILALPDETKIYIGHDYPKEGQKEAYISTVAEQKINNLMIHQNISEEMYIAARNAKDLNKVVPDLLLPAIQINLRAGDLGKKENNGVQYVKIPLNKIK